MGIPFKLYEGKEVNLPAELTAGGIYFCEDSGNVFIDVDIDGTLTRVPLGKKYVDDQLVDIREFIENQGSGIEIGSEPPTKESANVWIDTDDGDEEGVEYLGVVTSINGKGGDINITASDIDAAEKTHAAQHASGGSDPITPAAIGAVNKAGDTMTGGLKLNDSSGTSNDIARLSMYNTNCALRASRDENNYSEIMFSAITDPHFKGAVGGAYFDKTLLHTGNKPNGSYTGNGDDTERVLDESQIGGIGRCLLVTSPQGICIVTTNGALIARVGSGVVEAVYSSKVSFYNGKLTLKTNDSALNGVASDGSGFTYAYQVL